MDDRALILVAEDDRDDQYFFQTAVDVVCAQDVETEFPWDGSQLLRLLHEKVGQGYRRVLVVLDLNMPVRNGRATLDDIKSDPALTGIPVVILTTSCNDEDIEYCTQHGAAAYFTKPNSILDLVQIVRVLYSGYLAPTIFSPEPPSTP